MQLLKSSIIAHTYDTVTSLCISFGSRSFCWSRSCFVLVKPCDALLLESLVHRLALLLPIHCLWSVRLCPDRVWWAWTQIARHQTFDRRALHIISSISYRVSCREGRQTSSSVLCTSTRERNRRARHNEGQGVARKSSNHEPYDAMLALN